MYRKHSFESKLNFVSKIKNGVPISHLSRDYEIGCKKLLEWVRKYDLYGEQGLKKQPKTKASGQIKEKLVQKVLEELIPLSLVALKHGVSHSALESWVRLVKREGYISLYQENKRGRPLQL
jgi:transposase